MILSAVSIAVIVRMFISLSMHRSINEEGTTMVTKIHS